MNNENRLQILRERFSQQDSESDFKEWVQLQAEADPNFFMWFFGDEIVDDYGNYMTEEQNEEWQEFYETLLHDVRDYA